jgi:hypothetical protein
MVLGVGTNRGTGDGLDVVVSDPMLDAVLRHRDDLFREVGESDDEFLSDRIFAQLTDSNA